MHGFEVFDALHTHCEFYQQGEPYYHNCKIDNKELRICCYGECPIMKEFLKDASVRANNTHYSFCKPQPCLSPIKPNKPIVDLEKGILYLNGNTMKDLERNVKKENIIIEGADNDVGL